MKGGLAGVVQDYLEAAPRWFWLTGRRVAHRIRTKQPDGSRWLWGLCGAHDLLECAQKGNVIPADGRMCELCRKAMERLGE